MRILLAEDEKALSKVIIKILEKNNYSVDAVYNGENALFSLLNGNYDLGILDIMMPKLDGIEVLKKVREKDNQIPIIILSAKSEIEDKVIGLDSGANDYLAKPFDARELVARIRANTRSKSEINNELSFGNVSLNRSTYELSSPTGSCRLTSKEYQIMEYFLSDPHHVISTEKMMERVWGYDTNAEINVVWVYISFLRKKLTALNANIQIKAERNSGYYLEENV